MMEWLMMGKYGAYVWSSFGLTAIIIVTCAIQARRRHAAVLRDIARRITLMGNTE